MFTQILSLVLTSVIATSGVATDTIEQISYEDTTSTTVVSYEAIEGSSNELILESGDVLILSDDEEINFDSSELETKKSFKEECAEILANAKLALEEKAESMKADMEEKLAERKTQLAEKTADMKADMEVKLAEIKTQLAEKAESMKTQHAEKDTSME